MELKKGTVDAVNVKRLQELLVSKGFDCAIDGNFGIATEKQVKVFQIFVKQTPTGIVDDALMSLLDLKPSFKITDKFMSDGEYYKEACVKNTIYLHHTAGSYRPDLVIETWDTDDTVDEKIGKKTVRVVGTSFVIGGLSTFSNDASYNGSIYRAFDDMYWAHHLGTVYANNRKLNQQSIGIELCNYGPLTKSSNGKYYTYVNTVVPENMVCKLDKPFKGYSYYHCYTDEQLNSLKLLLSHLKQKYPNIEMRTPLLTVEGFAINDNSKKAVPGIYSHTNVREDKYDVYPHPKLLKILKELCT